MKFTAPKLPLVASVLFVAAVGYVSTGRGQSGAQPRPTIEMISKNVNGRTRVNTPTMSVLSPAAGKLTVTATRAGVADIELAKDIDVTKDEKKDLQFQSVLSEGTYEVRASLQVVGESEPREPQAFPLTVDLTGPAIAKVESKNEGKALVVTFANSDVDPAKISAGLTIHALVSGVASAPIANTPKPPNGNTVTLDINGNPLSAGLYEASVTADLLDDLANPADAAKTTFRVPFVSPVATTLTLTPIGLKAPSFATGGVWLSKAPNLTIDIGGIPEGAAGQITPYVNSMRQDPSDIANNRVSVILSKEAINTVSVSFNDARGNLVTSNPMSIKLDKTGPRLLHAEIIEVPDRTGTVPALDVTFEDSDFLVSSDSGQPKITTNDFHVYRQLTSGEFDETSIYNNDSPEVDGRTIRLRLGTLIAGDYQLAVQPTLTDIAGNAAGDGVNPQTWVFSVLGTRTFGQHVEFTPYAPPKKQTIPEEGFNPGDFVETRVARLYYFRDAHRVAQIINRNIRSFNQSAVTQAERRAENSRDNADDATDERRQKERAAARAAEKARNAEQQLADAQQTLAEVQRLTSTSTSYTNQKTTLEKQLTEPPEPADPADPKDPVNVKRAELKKQIAFLDTQLFQNKAAIDSIGIADPNQLEQQVANMQQTVANLRENELNARDVWNDAQAKEERAAAAQFRDEVTAAETDPDTYVAGDMHSEDPVTQCSISVIGEGLIQLRGPIKGINKIRTMINQIDSPVGQIKIGIFSVQVNGEEGDKMEKVVGDAESSIDLSRFLVNQSLNLLRRAIQSEAAIIAEQCELNGHYQVDRDRRYLYSFFGRDFIDELYEMNSEFMFSENKLLSLHSMDTISFNRAMFMLALAKNDVRERIVTRFLESAKTELPDAEFDFRRSSELKPHRTQKLFPPWNLTHLPIKNHYHKEQVIHEAVHRNALQRYHFRNFAGFFDTGFTTADTMNPMQREFIRLAQIFKARLVAEMEWKQRVVERGLFEDRANDDNLRYDLLKPVHAEALELERDAYQAMVETARTSHVVSKEIESDIAEALEVRRQTQYFVQKSAQIGSANNNLIADAGADNVKVFDNPRVKAQVEKNLRSVKSLADELRAAIIEIQQSPASTPDDVMMLQQNLNSMTKFEQPYALYIRDESVDNFAGAIANVMEIEDAIGDADTGVSAVLKRQAEAWEIVRELFRAYRLKANASDFDYSEVTMAYKKLDNYLNDGQISESARALEIRRHLKVSYEAAFNSQMTEQRIEQARMISKKTRGDLDQRKLLNHLIDEQEEKFIELVEGTRAHISVMDQYLKRLSIALEDDFKVQFYDPAFVRVREAARGTPVNLSQVERTTILTNNRDFAKVDPQATMEFDLPKRQIAIKEAFDAAKALVEDTGALVNDPTFLSAFQMMGGSAQPATVKNLIPGQSMSLDQHNLGHVPPQQQSSPGSSLQSLVPEPAIYKLETGTGFQIRPVMQPDGDSAVYDFDYMYTTNIREPVRADEKHVGRIKRHFVHTAVQTGNFELREISRYQVALKVSRTSRGVPLLEDIPVLGAAFRPAPSDESSLQQNVIFGQTNIYPTLFDLMGLRWAQQVVDLDHATLLETEHVIRGRQKSIRDFVFGEASRRVDDFLDLPNKDHDSYRPDFYRPQTLASPYHPRGYMYPSGVQDPTGNDFERYDRRPPEMQDPPYDRYRHQPVHPEQIGPQFAPEQIPMHSDSETLPIHQQNHSLQILPQTDPRQFRSLLLQGPSGAREQSVQPAFTDGASKETNSPNRVRPIQGRDASHGGMLEQERFSGMLKKSPTMPQLLPRPTDNRRGTLSKSTSTVVPASFEQPDRVSGRAKMRRLPPVR